MGGGLIANPVARHRNPCVNSAALYTGLSRNGKKNGCQARKCFWEGILLIQNDIYGEFLAKGLFVVVYPDIVSTNLHGKTAHANCRV
jgi:hypothetical protein